MFSFQLSPDNLVPPLLRPFMKEKPEKARKKGKPRSSKKQDSVKKPRPSKKQDADIPLPDREIKPAFKPKEKLPNLTNIIHDNVVTKMKRRT